jgi:chromosomal replication initiator protein
MLNRIPVKDALRAHLAQRCAEEDLCCWYDPLRIEMDQEASCLMVTFPHHLFGPWFARTGQDALESGLASCLGKKIPIRYLARRQHAASAAPGSPLPAQSVSMEKPFGELCTLERFIINKKNFFPLAVAREVAKAQREPTYNPLVYYGKSGSGKTHLLRAIANELSAAYNYRAVYYGNTATLIQESEQRGTVAGIDRYLAYCIDDIHLFANNFPLQEKLLVFLDACLYGKKQFVCACSGPLASHRGFSESLRSRLELGLIVELKNPDIDVRMRFAQVQCAAHGFILAREHLLLLAQHCEHLRYLSGVLLKIAAYAKLTQREIATQDIEKILKNSGEHSPVTPQHIIHRVAEYFSLPLEEITGNKRKPALVFARQTAMYLCREILGTSYPVLGQIFGGKDHSTVMYGIKKIEKYIVEHKNAHTEITELTNLCLQRND